MAVNESKSRLDSPQWTGWEKSPTTVINLSFDTEASDILTIQSKVLL